jgi:amino acid permease
VVAKLHMVIGLAGSAYGHCTESGTVHGNVLLDFPDDDPLLLVGRMCLAITITLAFPMLTIPARDILISILPTSWYKKAETIETTELTVHPAQTDEEELREPLLENETALHAVVPQDIESEADSVDAPASFRLRLVVVVIFFWSGALVASCVSSIDVVWALLGSSLSILLSHLIPCASFLVLSEKAASDDQGRHGWKNRVSRVVAWLLIVVFTPLMFLSTGNAVYDTFFRG